MENCENCQCPEEPVYEASQIVYPENMLGLKYDSETKLVYFGIKNGEKEIQITLKIEECAELHAGLEKVLNEAVADLNKDTPAPELEEEKAPVISE